MYPSALHKIPTQTVDSSQVLAKCIGQKQPQKIKSNRKNWDKNTIKDLEQVCPNKSTTSFQHFDRQRHFIQIDFISVIRHLVLVAQNSKSECYRKNHVLLEELT